MESHHIQFESVKKGSPQDAVLRRMAEVPIEQRSATRVLDLPAGTGIVAFPLSFAGFDVTACDLFPEDVQKQAAQLEADEETRRNALLDLPLPPDSRGPLLGQREPGDAKAVRVVQGDMEKAFPFDDASFDTVISVEGIEHIDMHEPFLQEARRVLSLGGRLLLTTPNEQCLRSRLAFALTGQRTLKTFIDETMSVQARDNERTYHGHIFLTNYFELRYLLHNNGFRIKQVLPSRLSPSSVLLAPFMVPPIALFTWLAARRWERKFRRCTDPSRVPAGTKPPYRDILRHALSKPLLFSGSLVIEAEAV